jgi:outer membrane immunogenic protein
MKKIAAAAAISAAFLTSAALAADMPAAPVYRAPVVVAAYNWSGFYLGGHGGWGTGDASATSLGFSRSPGIDGWFGGGQVGYNWQGAGSPWVFGIEADISGGDINGSQPFLGTTVTSSLNTFGTVRGRVGYAFDGVMIYGTGGWAWGKNKVTLTTPVLSAAVSDTASLSGWTIGGGIEWALVDSWTAKVEYLYLSYSNSDALSNWVVGGLQTDVNAHTIRFGLNYRFGGGVAPVVSKY